MLLGADPPTPDDRLWHIDLGHGDRDFHESFLTVVTDAKLPQAHRVQVGEEVFYLALVEDAIASEVVRGAYGSLSRNNSSAEGRGWPGENG
ncbi:MAG: hypothetical protein ACRDN9_00750 [Streptosporangiaceae bacterium]